jgi:hypothetical protein
MPADNSSDVHNPVRDMAAQIYVRLVSTQVAVNGDAIKIGTNPEGLAKASFKLAEAFINAEREIKASAAPTSVKFDVDKLDFDAWTTK